MFANTATTVVDRSSSSLQGHILYPPWPGDKMRTRTRVCQTHYCIHMCKCSGRICYSISLIYLPEFIQKSDFISLSGAKKKKAQRELKRDIADVIIGSYCVRVSLPLPLVTPGLTNLISGFEQERKFKIYLLVPSHFGFIDLVKKFPDRQP